MYAYIKDDTVLKWGHRVFIEEFDADFYIDGVLSHHAANQTHNSLIMRGVLDNARQIVMMDQMLGRVSVPPDAPINITLEELRALCNVLTTMFGPTRK